MRPTKDEYFMAQAIVVATRSTCVRRSVGCVLVDAHAHVIATGYNGPPSGWAHCNEEDSHVAYEHAMESKSGSLHLPGKRALFPHACAAAFEPSGANLDGCEAIHAEQNALLQCRDVMEIATCYATTPPCVTCTKLLLNTSCAAIVFAGDYVQAVAASELWKRGGRRWVKVQI